MSEKEGQVSLWDVLGRRGKSHLAASGMNMAQIGQALCHAIVDVGGGDEHAIALLSSPEKVRDMAKLATGMAKLCERPVPLGNFETGFETHEHLKSLIRSSGRRIEAGREQFVNEVEIIPSQTYQPVIIEAGWLHKDLWRIGVVETLAKGMGLKAPPAVLALLLATVPYSELGFDWLIVCHEPIKTDEHAGYWSGFDMLFAMDRNSLETYRGDKSFCWSESNLVGKGGFVFMS